MDLPRDDAFPRLATSGLDQLQSGIFMTAQQGALVLIKAGNGGSPEIFTTIGGLRTSSMTLGNQALDTTNVESGNWRQLMGSAGINSLIVSGSGIFTDAASEETVRGNAFASNV